MTVLDTTSAAPTNRVTPAIPATPALPALPDDLVGADGQQLRALRAALVEETLRLRRWQRLVQARLDLATDRLSPAEALHEAVAPGAPPWPVAPVDGDAPWTAGASGPADLVALVRGQVVGVTDAADDLRAVVTTHRALRAGALALAGRLAAVDGALAARGGARCCPKG